MKEYFFGEDILLSWALSIFHSPGINFKQNDEAWKEQVQLILC